MSVLGMKNTLDLPLGVKVAGGKMSPILDMRTPFPVRKARTHAVIEEFATWTVFQIYEGNHERASRNRKLGELRVDNIPSSAAGEQQLEVMMEVDGGGLLHVSAKLLSTGQVARISICRSRYCALGRRLESGLGINQMHLQHPHAPHGVIGQIVAECESGLRWLTGLIHHQKAKHSASDEVKESLMTGSRVVELSHIESSLIGLPKPPEEEVERDISIQ